MTTTKPRPSARPPLEVQGAPAPKPENVSAFMAFHDNDDIDKPAAAPTSPGQHEERSKPPADTTRLIIEAPELSHEDDFDLPTNPEQLSRPMFDRPVPTAVQLTLRIPTKNSDFINAISEQSGFSANVTAALILEIGLEALVASFAKYEGGQDYFPRIIKFLSRKNLENKRRQRSR